MAILNILLAVLSVALILMGLVEGFESLVLPRRIERASRLTPYFYRGFWRIWVAMSRLYPREKRDNVLAIFGPLSLLALMSIWAMGLILGFATLQWSLHVPIRSPDHPPAFETYLYLSATTFITLGYGDVSPETAFGRALADIEAGIGFGFLAIIIGYMPVLYAAFSRREVEIALLDARASSPPSAGALLERVGPCTDDTDLYAFLHSYERWAGELIESHLSYPILMYYRSQHERQSWLSTLTTILDACAFLIAYTPQGKVNYQARMTFAMCRHSAIDLALVFDIPPALPIPDRLPLERLTQLKELIRAAGLEFKDSPVCDERLNELRHLYEPFVNAISTALLLPLPDWLPNHNLPDNWQTSQWDRNDHFFRAREI